MCVDKENGGLISEETLLDYMAGIVDTEGFIGYDASIRLVVVNTDIRLIKWLKKEFGGNYYLVKKEKGHKQAWRWLVSGKDAYRVIKKINGRLLLKNEQLLLNIEMHERIIKHNFRRLPLWAKNAKEEIAAELHVLNERGVDKTGILRPDSEIKIKNKLAYLGGYWDGDGTIGIKKDKKMKLPYYHHYMSAGSTDSRSLNWIKKNFGGTITPEEAKDEQHAKSYQWYLHGKNAYKLIKSFREYLMPKQGQADAVITMYEEVTRHDFRPRPAWAVKLQEEMFQRCKELNKTGDIGEPEIEVVNIKINSQKELCAYI